MSIRTLKLFLPLALVFTLRIEFSGQMPDWQFFKDRDGNSYFMDRAGKIYTSGEPLTVFKPPSVAEAEFFVHYARDLIMNRHRKEGLTVLKSILAMPVRNKRVRDAQILSAKKINEMKMREGNRFDELDRDSFLLIYREENTTHLINENMRFSVAIPADVFVMRSKIRSKTRYYYSGLSLGIKLREEASGKDKKESFDAILAIDGEKYPYKIKSVHQAESIWKKILGYDTFQRKELLRDGNRIIYKLENKIEPPISGFEGIYFNQDCGFIVRMITSSDKFQAQEKMMQGVIESFRLVSYK